jgi:transposase
MQNEQSVRRFFGFDIHRDYAVIAAVSSPQQVVVQPRRVDYGKLGLWIKQHLGPDDHVAIEATVNAWTLYDQIAPHVARCVVADARQVRVISHAAVKTDALDALRLAKLLCADMLPLVWVPPPHVRDLRALVAHRDALCKRRTIALNRMRSVLNRHNLDQPADLTKDQTWLDAVACHLSSVEHLLVRDDLLSLVPINSSITAVDQTLAVMSQNAPWSAMASRIMQLSGFGFLHTMTVLGAIGDISRFDRPEKLGSYTGLYPSKDQSGQKDRSGRITKHGRRDLRHVLVEAARSAVQFDPRWKAEFSKLSTRMHEHQALVAVARQLAEVIWHVLHEAEPAKHISDDQLAKKFLSLRDQLVAQGLKPAPSRFFIRQQLRALGRSGGDSKFMHGKRPRVIATDAELDAYQASLSPD